MTRQIHPSHILGSSAGHMTRCLAYRGQTPGSSPWTMWFVKISTLSNNPYNISTSVVQDCHEVSKLSQDVPCICVHYTLCLNHTLIQTYCPTIILGIPMAILDSITGLAQSCAIYRAHAIEHTSYPEDPTGQVQRGHKCLHNFCKASIFLHRITEHLSSNITNLSVVKV